MFHAKTQNSSKCSKLSKMVDDNYYDDYEKLLLRPLVECSSRSIMGFQDIGHIYVFRKFQGSQYLLISFRHSALHNNSICYWIFCSRPIFQHIRSKGHESNAEGKMKAVDQRLCAIFEVVILLKISIISLFGCYNVTKALDRLLGS